MSPKIRSTSSFRDPSGFVFIQNNKVYRQINNFYKENYDYLISSGLYKKLSDDNLLIKHKELKVKNKDFYKTIEPQRIPFISYPYEWSFAQLKDVALTTLEIQLIALEHGMSLKDASTYNIAFIGYKPIFLDTLSFEKYETDKPWVAYKQFCQHFLAPLALMAKTDISLNQLMITNIDGVSLPLASKLLPKTTYLNFGILSNIHLHARSQSHYSDKQIETKKYKMSKNALVSLINSLENTIKNLNQKNKDTEWGEYYTFTNYSKMAFKHKKELVKKYIKDTNSKTLWDFGANTGEFSQLASEQGIYTVAFDIDPVAVQKGYLSAKKRVDNNMHNLLLNLTNPSPGIGWANRERDTLEKRGPVDMIMALALIHHLAISNNLPFELIADYFSSLSDNLIIEFVPKDDSQVQILLSTREDIFTNYSESGFEKAFKDFYKIIKKDKIKDSKRIMYLMKKI